ncbi:MAG: ferrous iron transport protein B [Robiginitomaculum sp.]
MSEANDIVRVALLGAPNCGKSSLFNALTGRKAKVANYPGVTVEYSKGFYTTKSGQKVELLDLPGVYGDCGHSADEKVTIDALRGELDGERAPDAIIFMMDASRISTHLHNLLQAKNYGIPITLCLNMMDIAARDGVEIDTFVLEGEIGMEVGSTVAVRASGRANLENYLDTWLAEVAAGEAVPPEPEPYGLKELQARARRMASAATKTSFAPTHTSRIDDIVLHPVIGPIILFGLLFLMFQAVFAWAAPIMDMIEGVFAWIGGLVSSVLPPGDFQSLIVDGVIGGVGSVVVFLPQIIILFAFILILEASGYMARAAFLMDTLMAKIGLSGRAFIPLLSSFACAIPGIMSARTIENEKDRITTILIAPLMTCSARLPVYVILISAFFPKGEKVGPFGLQGIVMFSLYMAGIVFALLAAFILKKTVTKGPPPGLLMELPSYKIPSLGDYLQGLWTRAWMFIRRAGVIIFPASVIMWFLSTYPKGGGIETTFAGYIGRVLQPVLAPIGFNLEMSISIVPAMAAREIAVATLGTVYAVQDSEGVTSGLEMALKADWTLPMALSFLAWFVFAPQCLSTFAVMKRETNSWRWPAFAFSYLMIMAYVASGLTFHLASGAGL